MSAEDMAKDPVATHELTVATVTEDASVGDAEAFALEFLSKVVRLRGVRISREDFLGQELRKAGLGYGVIARAIETTPVQAGVSLDRLDKLAAATIAFETRKSAAISFAAGLPGGLAMLAAIPADITQYYVHAFRVMQKIAYLYGWQEFIKDLDEVDDETLAKVSLFLGVMMGVGGASSSLVGFAQQIARPALQKQIAKQALTKTAWYGPMKQTLKMVGIKVTKDSFAKSVTKAVPVAGGVISGGMTFFSLKDQAKRLQQHLRQLPPPGADAEEYAAALRSMEAQESSADQRSTVVDAAENASSFAKGLTSGATGAVRSLAARVKSRKATPEEAMPEATDDAR